MASRFLAFNKIYRKVPQRETQSYAKEMLHEFVIRLSVSLRKAQRFFAFKKIYRKVRKGKRKVIYSELSFIQHKS